MPNDIEMLSWSGLGVAMANADSSVRQVADVVTRSNLEDGVADYLQRAVLGATLEPQRSRPQRCPKYLNRHSRNPYKA